MTNLSGQILDRYRIIGTLGEGGMATVYKAFDTRLEREVAIKVIRRDAFPPEQLELMLKRFEREAKTLARLSHPHIVDVLDYGEYEGAPYLVMAYLAGGTLKQRMGQSMPWQEAVRLLTPIARALEYAHERNVINRDVKPTNILFTEQGQPMLTDFGLVKLLEKRESTSLTSSDTGIGTPGYMAPEQWVGETSPQSDQYSLGVVLYELITNHMPYAADTPAGLLIKQATEPLPPPRHYVPNLPWKVEAFLLKALAKDQKNRHENMRAFADALEDLPADQGKSDASSAVTFKAIPRPEPVPDVPIPQAPDILEARQLQTPPVQKAKPRSKWPVWIILGGMIGALCIGAGVCRLLNPTAKTTETPVPVSTDTRIPPMTATLEERTVITLPPSAPLPEITDAKGVHMRYVEAGEFIMGHDDGDSDVQPESNIYLDGYYIDSYEVTNILYKACVNDGRCKSPQRGGSATRTSYFSSPKFDNYPVIFVDWNMANAYCKWRGARLPTEAEWEKAARGTDGRIYPWGDDLQCSLANYSGCVGDTTSVGFYEDGQSIYGVYDMAGNVWEWVSSLHRTYPYNPDDGREELGTSGSRVARGGSWHFIGGNVNSYTRYVLDPSYYGLYVGFRCALTP